MPLAGLPASLQGGTRTLSFVGFRNDAGGIPAPVFGLGLAAGDRWAFGRTSIAFVLPTTYIADKLVVISGNTYRLYITDELWRLRVWASILCQVGYRALVGSSCATLATVFGSQECNRRKPDLAIEAFGRDRKIACDDVGIVHFHNPYLGGAVRPVGTNAVTFVGGKTRTSWPLWIDLMGPGPLGVGSKDAPPRLSPLR